MSTQSSNKQTIAILGGTGDLGTGLAIRWAKAGHEIVIGSRTQAKAEAAVAALHEISPGTPARALENPAAAEAGDVVVLTVPFAHQLSTLETVKSGLQGKNPDRHIGAVDTSGCWARATARGRERGTTRTGFSGC